MFFLCSFTRISFGLPATPPWTFELLELALASVVRPFCCFPFSYSDQSRAGLPLAPQRGPRW